MSLGKVIVICLRVLLTTLKVRARVKRLQRPGEFGCELARGLADQGYGLVRVRGRERQGAEPAHSSGLTTAIPGTNHARIVQLPASKSPKTRSLNQIE